MERRKEGKKEGRVRWNEKKTKATDFKDFSPNKNHNRCRGQRDLTGKERQEKGGPGDPLKVYHILV